MTGQEHRLAVRHFAQPLQRDVEDRRGVSIMRAEAIPSLSVGEASAPVRSRAIPSRQREWVLMRRLAIHAWPGIVDRCVTR
jgi:hypothetical protein